MDIFIPYLFIYSFVTLCAVVAGLFKSLQKPVFYVCAVAVFLFVGLRNYTVGTDTSHYMDFFLHPEMGYGGGDTDFGFDVLVNVLHIFLTTYAPFNIVISAIYLFGLFFLMKKDCRFPMTALFLFVFVGTAECFFHQYMNIIRQCTAMSFYFIALHYFNRYILLQQRENIVPVEADAVSDADAADTIETEAHPERSATDNLILAAIFYVVAISIHATVLISLPVLFICWRGLNFNKVIWIALLLGSYVLGVQNYFSVSDLFLSLFSLFGKVPYFIDKYAGYGTVNFGEVENQSFFNWMLIPFTLWACAIILFSKEEERKSLFTKMFCCGVMLNNTFNDNLMWARLFMCFTMLIIIVLPNTMERLRWWIRMPFFVVFFVYYVYKTFNQFMYMWITPSSEAGNVIIPYETFFSS